MSTNDSGLKRQGAPVLDPDRFLNLEAPGSQEWWYFDALSDDGRDAVVIVFYVGLPFDPRYIASTLRHVRDPRAHPAPDPLDHCAFGIHWYRLEGSSRRRRGPGNPGPLAEAYALIEYNKSRFEHQCDPFSVGVGPNRLSRRGTGYRIEADVPDLNPRYRIRADLHFRVDPRAEPLEFDLGSSGSPHRWMLAAADCRVDGTIALEGRDGSEAVFAGRGYHDHNAGDEELSVALRRWEWGRVHMNDRTEIYYDLTTRLGETRRLWITCRNGRPERVRRDPTVEPRGPRQPAFGAATATELTIRDGADHALERTIRRPLDAGPFYHRWLAAFRRPELDGPPVLGISEFMNPPVLNHPLVRLMIPFRLRRHRD